MSDSIQPAVLERPRELTELSQLAFEVIAGDYSHSGNQPANYTLVKGRREALLVDVPFGRADAHRLIARILDTGLKLHTIFITQSRPDHVSSLDLLTNVFPDASVVAHSAVAADIKQLIPQNSDRRAEGISDNATRRSIIPAPLGTDHIRLEGHKLEILGPVQGGHVHATALWDPRTGTLVAGGLAFREADIRGSVRSEKSRAGHRGWAVELSLLRIHRTGRRLSRSSVALVVDFITVLNELRRDQAMGRSWRRCFGDDASNGKRPRHGRNAPGPPTLGAA